MKILSIFLLIGALTLNCFSLPLVFKTTKSLVNPKKTEYVELALFEAGKYKKLRVGASVEDTEFPLLGNVIRIEGIEGEDSVILDTFILNEGKRSNSIPLDTFPNKIRISVKESGKYKVFVWAE